MQVSAKLKNLRISPRKTRLVAELIRSLDVENALDQLEATIKGACSPIKKLLESAIANGENNFGIDRDNMYVADVIVNAGPTLKRWMPKAYGRAGQILKRTSRVEIVVAERVEGKGRKTREQMEKERKERLAAKRKLEKNQAEEAEKESREEAEKKGAGKAVAEKKEKGFIRKENKKSWASRIFRRKSM